MNYEESRLRSFKNWPSNAGVDPRKIAKAGFYYMGQGLEVQCFSCGVRISDWNYGDRVVAVITRHKALDPGCPFIRNPEQSGNVPLVGSSRQSSVDNAQTSQRSTGTSCSTSRVESFQNESVRLESFAKWPVSFISCELLAKSGFYYTGEGDKVQCAFCDGIVEGWDPGDIPNDEHKRHFPKCSFLNRILNENTNFTSGISVRDSTDSYNGDYEELKWLGVQSHRVPHTPQYSTYEARLRSFKNWPPSISQTPEQLADAGFFFTGRGDQVRCFHCDGGLRLWEKSDVPWQEHARWFRDCGFVFLVKGQQFIDETLSVIKTSIHPVKGETGVVRSHAFTKVKILTEEELQSLMHSPQAMVALEVGLEPYRVKMALKQKVEETGVGFASAEGLIGAAVGLQNQEESHDEDDTWLTPPDSPVTARRVVPRWSSGGQPPPANSPPHRDSSAPSSLTLRGSVSPSPSSSRETSPTSHKNNNNLSVEERFDHPNNMSPTTPSHSTSSSVSEKSIGWLEEEVRRLRELRQCKVCMDREVSVVFLPCGHLVTCAHCAHSLADCPLCRHIIRATVRTFLS